MLVRAPQHDHAAHSLGPRRLAAAGTDGEPASDSGALQPPALPLVDTTPAAPLDEPATVSSLSRQVIEQALQQAGGNISRAARQLGVSRGLLYRRLERERKKPPGPPAL